MRRTLSLTAALVIAATAAAADPPTLTDRWFYSMGNLQIDATADRLISLIGRAGKAGYTGVVLADYKLNVLDRVTPRYFENSRRVKEAADAAGLEVIPAVFPIGYSNGLLAHDPDLAEGPPVIDAPFVVRAGVAVLDSPPIALKNGGFEEAKGKAFAGWGYQDGAGTQTVIDTDTKHGGRSSCRMQEFRGQNCRVIQAVKLRPHACYRLGCWVKTKDLHPADFKLLANSAKRPLTHHESHLKPTQDWTRVDVVFNSLDQTDVSVYAGFWGGGTGTLWLDDLSLEELGPVNILRRPGCPFAVKSRDGATVYEEGRDFDTVRDPKLGRVPYEGEYEFDHPAAIIRLTKDSRIRDGNKLAVSWYHPVLVHGEQVACCVGEPRLAELLRDQARRVEKLWLPKTYFMSHDEFRVGGWCRACGGKTPGESLAANVQLCADILKEVSPSARVAVWSDMFDPHHNAVDNYYLVNGSLRGSWAGLPKNVLIANWNRGHAAESLKWFADRGHGQIMAGYYDRDEPPDFAEWSAAAKELPGVTGFMYTTWEAKYDKLEAFGELMRGGRP